MGILNVILSLALVGQLGILGVALGTAIPNVLFAVFVVHLACKDLGVPAGEYATYVAGRAVIGATVPLAALVTFRQFVGFAGLPQLVAGGLVLVAVFAATWFLFVYRDDPYLPLPRRRSPLPRPGEPS
jgi:O-antigen/teichoic acid export membrane protein